MKVLGLQIENMRKIKALNLEFSDKGLIQIRGKNSQGKTTILDAIEMLLKGKKYTPDDVVTHGAEKARVIGQVGEYKIERVISDDSNRLKITNADGMTRSEKPQAFLDTLVNALTFNPRPFLDKTSEQKLKFMMETLEIDFTELDAKLKEKEQTRLLVGREVKAFGNIVDVPKVEEVDVVELMKEKTELDNINTQIVELRNRSDSETSEIKRHMDSIYSLKEQIKKHERDMKVIDETNQMTKKELKELGDLRDVEPINEKILKASKINEEALAYRNNERQKELKAAKVKEYDLLSSEIEQIRQDKAITLREAKMPLKGLEIKHDGVYCNGIHSDNWSDSEAIRISFELCVALNPELRAVFIDKGESYDADGLKSLEKWAIENDIQVFITIVDSDETQAVDGAIYMVEGEAQ